MPLKSKVVAFMEAVRQIPSLPSDLPVCSRVPALSTPDPGQVAPQWGITLGLG